MAKKKVKEKKLMNCPPKKNSKFLIMKYIFYIYSQNYVPDGKKKAPKCIEMNIKGLGWPCIEVTASGLPSVESPVLKKLIGDSKN